MNESKNCSLGTVGPDPPTIPEKGGVAISVSAKACVFHRWRSESLPADYLLVTSLGSIRFNLGWKGGFCQTDRFPAGAESRRIRTWER